MTVSKRQLTSDVTDSGCQLTSDVNVSEVQLTVDVAVSALQLAAADACIAIRHVESAFAARASSLDVAGSVDMAF